MLSHMLDDWLEHPNFPCKACVSCLRQWEDMFGRKYLSALPTVVSLYIDVLPHERPVVGWGVTVVVA